MLKPILPIQNISAGDFNGGFKKKHLDSLLLRDDDLMAIEHIFGLDDGSTNSKVGRVDCCEYHTHDYRCNGYYSPEAGVVDRLIIEIGRYKSRLAKIEGIAKLSE